MQEKKGSAKRRKKTKTNEGPSFDGESKGRKEKKKQAELSPFSLSSLFPLFPPPHFFPPLPQQEMCAQMYYRGKMFGFVHLYSGQEAVSTGVIR